jgi:actin-related protein 3
MGYAGNNDPAFIIPTAIATREAPSASGAKTAGNVASKRGIEDLDYFIGDEAMANARTYAVQYPIRHGQVESWDLMEKYHQACIFQYMRCEPEDHYFLLVRNYFHFCPFTPFVFTRVPRPLRRNRH